MSLPTYDQFIDPILRFLYANPDGVPARAVHDGVAAILQLTPEQKNEVIPSGQPVYKNRSGWAHDRLKRAGLSSSPRRGHWQLTPAGRRFCEDHPAPLPPSKVEELATQYNRVLLSGESEEEPNLGTQSPTPEEAHLSPEEQIHLAVSKLEANVAADVLEQLMQVSPSRFESIVLDLLHQMGYGARRENLQKTPDGSDGGIDGIISLDALGLEKVYVQAKRWANTVGRPEIQAFYGALAGRRATKGVFISTSRYSQQAIDFAESIERIVLIDGEQLAHLMIAHEVGVSRKHVALPSLDTDYFEE